MHDGGDGPRRGGGDGPPGGVCRQCVHRPAAVQNATVVVSVSRVGAGASVTTVAHYKTTTTTKRATATGAGQARLSYLIGRATHGFKVVVDVTATKGAARWACSTSFTTR